MVKIETTRFGELEVHENEVVRFPEGLLGFPDHKDFVILEHKADSPFFWLQSLSAPALAFVMMDPFMIRADYLEELSRPHTVLLENIKEEKAALFALVTIPPGKVEEMTVNLLGPLVVDLETRVGKQVILDNSDYSHRHPVAAA